MSQFYDQASLVMVPSGYKNGKVYSQKPLSADGELTFTRASNATRIGPDGKLEKVRTNLLLQSNIFNVTWNPTNGSVTSGQSGYDGTSNAWLLSKTAANGRINQNVSLNAGQTFSIYAKAGASSWLKLQAYNGTTLFYCSFNLSAGTLGTTSGCTAVISLVSNGWYRCSITMNIANQLLYVYPAEGDNDTSGTSGNILIQNAQLEVSDFGPTDYIPTTSAAVSVGPVSGLPRLDYSGGCPSLLLEPQRTNSLTYSEQFDNATYAQTAMSVTANAAISPDGYQNADKLTPSTTATNHYLTKSATFSGDGVLSVYAKADGYNYLIFLNSSGNVNFNLSNGTASEPTASMVSVGNGWYRCTFRKTFANGTMYLSCGSSSAAAFFNGAGDGTSGVLLYGFQLEAGSYATSYISTQGSAVTRLADAAYKTGISSLIGQTEGTLFAEINGLSNDTVRLAISDGTNNNNIYLELSSNNIVAVGRLGGLNQFAISSSQTVTNNNKVAIKYKQNDFALYINGVQVGTDTSGNTYSANTLNSLRFDRGDGGILFYGNAKQVLIFPTALSATDLATLTTL